ncbi:MAG: IPT/TIG domain-containing protein, partial [Ignavibacteriaceae bacterium]
MKAHRFLVVAIVFLATIITIIINGCEFDVAEPLWEKDYDLPSSPVITGIEPSEGAVPGVNKIVIRGENFIGISSDHSVYFEIPDLTTVLADLVEVTQTSITVRRPNLVTQSAMIKINSDSAGLVVKYGPYKIDKVVEEYGSFLENLELRSVTVD